MLGFALMVGTGIYPPWVTIQQSVVPTPGGPAQSETQYPAGYSFIFDPPQVRDVQSPYLRISIRIDFSRLLMRWIVYYAEMELTDRKFQHILLFKPIEGARFAGGDHHMCLRKYSSFDRKANQS